MEQNDQIQSQIILASQKCSSCGAMIFPTDNFCSHCGAKISKELDHIGIGRQIYIYSISILAPPFGLIWTFKYLRQNHSQVKWVGMVAGILTLASLWITIWLTVGFIQTTQNILNSTLNPSSSLNSNILNKGL